MFVQNVSQKNLWIAAAVVWFIGLLLLGVGGYIWWSRQSQPDPGVQVTPTSDEITTDISPTREADDVAEAEAIPTETATAKPTSTKAKQGSGDVISLPSTPTSTPTPQTKEVILFLSSRDHDPQTTEERRQLAQNRSVELYMMEIDGSNQVRLSDGDREWWNGAASPLVLYNQSNQVIINGKDVFDLENREVVDELPTEDGKIAGVIMGFGWLQFASTGQIMFSGQQDPDSMGVYILDSLRDTPQKLTYPPDSVWGDGWPDWSPDGEWIVFERYYNDASQDGLWLIRADGSDAHRILSGDAEGSLPRQARFSPDGTKLVYECPKPDADSFLFEICVVDRDGSNAKQLTFFPPDFGGAWSPRWSPDGETIVFELHVSVRGERQIYAIDADGGEPRLLASEGDNNMAPLWITLTDSAAETADSEFAALALADPTPTPTQVYIPPTATPVPACPNPGVQINSPAPGTTFYNRYVFVVGNANIANFHHYRIEYSTVKDGHSWSYLFENDYPVDNGQLMKLDTSTVPNGPYGLRLTVVDNTGNYPEPCEVWFYNGY